MTDTLHTSRTSAPRLPAYNAQRIGFAAGVVAAVVMLLAIVILRVLSGVTSLPEVVAEGLLSVMPGALFSAVSAPGLCLDWGSTRSSARASSANTSWPVQFGTRYRC